MDIEIVRASLPKDSVHLAQMDIEIFGSDAFSDPADWLDELECFWVIIGGNRVGSIAIKHDSTITAWESHDYTYEPGCMYIVSTGLLPKCRGLGIGSYLKAWEVNYAKLHHFTRVITNCRTSNCIMVNLNKKFGFSEINRIRNYYENPTEDAVILELCLES